MTEIINILIFIWLAVGFISIAKMREGEKLSFKKFFIYLLGMLGGFVTLVVYLVKK